MRYAIKTSSRAEIDIDAIVSRIEHTVSWHSAARWQAGLVAAVRKLAIHPVRYQLADEADEIGIELRQMLYGRKRHVYRILYTIDGQTVTIHSVRHAAQDSLKPGDI